MTTRRELILGFLEFVENKASIKPWCDDFNDQIALCAGPISGYMDDAMFLNDDEVKQLIDDYLGSLKK